LANVYFIHLGIRLHDFLNLDFEVGPFFTLILSAGQQIVQVDEIGVLLDDAGHALLGARSRFRQASAHLAQVERIRRRRACKEAKLELL
jgi:hypothetical protein